MVEVHLDYCLEAAGPKYWAPTVSYRNKWTADLAAPMYFWELVSPKDSTCKQNPKNTPQKHIYNSRVLNLPFFPTEHSSGWKTGPSHSNSQPKALATPHLEI